MDILNFISWIKAKRLLKSAPQNSLLPIGVLDNRRGDKYQTYAIAPGDLGIGVITLDSYTELYDLLISESLVPGAKYRFPYRNVNFLNGWITADNNPTPIDPSFNPREIFVGDEEMLVVEAITESELSPTAHSESFSQDIIEYLPYANKIGVNLSISNGNTLPNGSTVSGFDLAWDGANVYFNMPAGYPAYYGHYFYLYCEFTDNVTGGGNISSYYGDLIVLPSGNLNGFNGASNIPVQGTFPSLQFEVPFTINGTGVLVGNLRIDVYGSGPYLFGVSSYDPLSLMYNAGYGFSVGDELYFSFGGHNYTLVLDSSMISATNGTFYVNNYTTSGDGQNAEFFVTINNDPVKPNYSLFVNNSGEFFVSGDLVTINGSELLGITGVNNLTFNVNATSLITDSYYQDGTYEPLTPNGFCQYPFANDDPDYDYGKTMSRIRLDNGGNKVVLLDLTYQDYLNYDSNSLYIDHIQALGNAYGCITRRYDTENQINVPFDFRSTTYRRYEVDLTPINNDLGIGYWGIGDNFKGQGTTGNYKDLLSIDWKGYEIYNIKVGAQGGMDAFWYNGYFDNNVFLGYAYDTTIEGSYSPNNTIGNGFGANTIGPYFSNNTIGLYFNNNIIGVNFTNNIIGLNFVNNTIGIYFYSNTIYDYFQKNTTGYSFSSNTIDNNFIDNTIGNDFGNNTIGLFFTNNTTSYSFSNNAIDDNFQKNTIDDNFLFNIIGDSFIFNTIGAPFQSNIIGPEFQLNNISKGTNIVSTNFTIGATFVYGDYNCNIFKRLDGTVRLSYVDGTNIVQYQLITG